MHQNQGEFIKHVSVSHTDDFVFQINIGADHRVLDGATVARFCNDWKKFVEKPDLLLLHTR